MKKVFVSALVGLALAQPVWADSDSLFKQAGSAETQGQVPHAEALYRQILATDSKSSLAIRSRLRLARIAVNQGHFKKAEPTYLEALKIPKALAVKDPELMIDMDDFAEAYNAQARKLPDARDCLLHALELRKTIDPGHPNVNESYRQLSLYMVGHRDYKAGEEYISQAIARQTKPANADRMSRLATDQAFLCSIYVLSNKWDKTEQLAKVILQETEKFPSLSWAWPQAHCLLGRCYARKLDFSRSDSEYHLAMELAKKYPRTAGDIVPECIKGLKENIALQRGHKNSLKVVRK